MTHLAIWEDGTVTEVPTLPGYTRTTGTVNDDGMVIATSCAASCFSETAPKRGFVWDDGQVTTLPPVPGDESSKASWGNGSGLVVGASENIYEEPDDPRDEWRFVVWQDGELIWVQGEGGDHLGINPGPTGNGAWGGGAVTDDDVAFIGNTDFGGTIRWKDGVVAPWPYETAPEALVLGVSPNGRYVVGLAFPLDLGERLEKGGTWGVWRDGEFFRIDLESMPISRCRDVSDAGHVLCLAPAPDRDPFVAMLDFGDDAAPTIDGVIAYYQEALADGTLLGSGPAASGDRRRNALLAMLEEARAMIESEQDAGDICGQLTQVLRRTDGVSRPPDFVDGPAAPTLAQRVASLMSELGCEPVGDASTIRW
jgi:hypothetical protein